MYEVSDAYKAAITSAERRALGYITDLGGTIILDQKQLQSIEIEQAANSGDDLTLGSYLSDCIAITAMDPDGAIAAMPWGEMEFIPWLGVETTAGPEMVPMGVFTAGTAETENDAPVVKIEMCIRDSRIPGADDLHPGPLDQKPQSGGRQGRGNPRLVLWALQGAYERSLHCDGRPRRAAVICGTRRDRRL